MTYEDLLLVPYKAHGRDSSGMDCYGLVLECCKRTGQNLRDVVYETDNVDADKLGGYTASLNVREIDKPKMNCIVQCEYCEHLHIGFMLDKKTVIHETYSGVRITPTLALKNIKYFEVTE